MRPPRALFIQGTHYPRDGTSENFVWRHIGRVHFIMASIERMGRSGSFLHPPEVIVLDTTWGLEHPRVCLPQGICFPSFKEFSQRKNFLYSRIFVVCFMFICFEYFKAFNHNKNNFLKMLSKEKNVKI
jgi:hypothetical protein